MADNTETSLAERVVPFGVNFAEPCEEMSRASTDTRSTSDADTSTYRKDTEDEDT